MGEELLRQRLGAHTVQVDAGAVVTDLDHDLAAVVAGREAQHTFGRLAGATRIRASRPRGRPRCARMRQRVLERLDERLVELGVLTLHLDAHLLVAREGEVAHDPRELVPDGLDRLHPGAQHTVLQVGREVAQLLDPCRPVPILGSALRVLDGHDPSCPNRFVTRSAVVAATRPPTPPRLGGQSHQRTLKMERRGNVEDVDGEQDVIEQIERHARFR